MSVFSRLVVTTLPVVPKFVVGKVASRYVAGSTMEDALRTVKRLNGDGAMATLDILGEEVQEAEKTHAAVEQYLALYREIADRGLDANVSVKPTMLGLKIDRGIFRDHILRLAEAGLEEPARAVCEGVLWDLNRVQVEAHEVLMHAPDVTAELAGFVVDRWRSAEGPEKGRRRLDPELLAGELRDWGRVVAAREA